MNAVVKKVKPYPFPVQITVAPGAVEGQVLRLEVKGFIADVKTALVKVGSLYQVSFEIPVSRFVVTGSAVVMKSSDRPNPAEQKVDRLAEFHFGQLNDEQRRNIQNFLNAIHQNPF